MITDFGISDDTVVVTTSYVTLHGRPVLEVSHDDDEEGGSLWQFHCGDGDYSPEKLQLVALHTVLALDPSLSEVAGLRVGSTARRSSNDAPWCVNAERRR